MSNALDRFQHKQVRLTEELRRAVMSGNVYKKFRHILNLLDDLEITCEELIGDFKDATARFKKAGGVITELEDGRMEYRIQDTSMTVSTDEYNRRRRTVIIYDDYKDQDRLNIINGMIDTMRERPRYEGLLEYVKERRKKLEEDNTIDANSGLSRLIRGDTGTTLYAISGMDEVEEEGDSW